MGKTQIRFDVKQVCVPVFNGSMVIPTSGCKLIWFPDDDSFSINCDGNSSGEMPETNSVWKFEMKCSVQAMRGAITHNRSHFNVAPGRSRGKVKKEMAKLLG